MAQSDNGNKTGFFDRLRQFFHKDSENLGKTDDKFRLEPQYWQEVIDFREHIQKLVAEHTISDNNVQIINGRIIDYMLDQINAKGSIKDIHARYEALDTLADRFLASSLNKIVGMKQEGDSTRAEFTEAVQTFKTRLHERREEELSQAAKNKP